MSLSMISSVQRDSPGHYNRAGRTIEPFPGRGGGAIRIGISGWRYPPWRGGAFYPKGLPQRRELEYAARALPSIEINGSFYSLQRPENYAAWYDATPAGLRLQRQGLALYHPHAAP